MIQRRESTGGRGMDQRQFNEEAAAFVQSPLGREWGWACRSEDDVLGNHCTVLVSKRLLSIRGPVDDSNTERAKEVGGECDSDGEGTTHNEDDEEDDPSALRGNCAERRKKRSTGPCTSAEDEEEHALVTFYVLYCTAYQIPVLYLDAERYHDCGHGRGMPLGPTTLQRVFPDCNCCCDDDANSTSGHDGVRQGGTAATTVMSGGGSGGSAITMTAEDFWGPVGENTDASANAHTKGANPKGPTNKPILSQSFCELLCMGLYHLHPCDSQSVLSNVFAEIDFRRKFATAVTMATATKRELDTNLAAGGCSSSQLSTGDAMELAHKKEGLLVPPSTTGTSSTEGRHCYGQLSFLERFFRVVDHSLRLREGLVAGSG